MKEGKGDSFQGASNSNGMNAAMARSAGPEAGAPAETREAGRGWQRRVGMWVQPGGSGQEVGKPTGFAHIAPGSTRLGPDNSTQVVDFPHLSRVRLFWASPEIAKTNEKWANPIESRGLPNLMSNYIISTHQDTLIFTLATLI
jgi:hypothetical protein